MNLDRVDKIYKVYVFVFIIVISLAMHFPHFTKDIVSVHAWRQTQTQSNIISFYEEDFNIFHPRQTNRADRTDITP